MAVRLRSALAPLDGGEGRVPMDHFAVCDCLPGLAVARRNLVCPGQVRPLKVQNCSEVCPEPGRPPCMTFTVSCAPLLKSVFLPPLAHVMWDSNGM